MVRMFADNFPHRRILAEIHSRFPEHRPEGASPVSKNVLRNIERKRQTEIVDLRAELNAHLSDKWIANKRQRITQLQNIFEDANRWVPKRALRLGDGEDRRVVIVYEKDTGTMLNALRQAREEVGDDADSRQAQTLEDLVRVMEKDRGLEETSEIDVTPAGAAPQIAEGAELAEVPAFYPSRGADPERGILAGDEEIEDIVDVADNPPE